MWQKNYAVYQNNEYTSHENKEVEVVQPVQMNIHQTKTNRKGLNYLHFDDKPRAQEKSEICNICILLIICQFYKRKQL